LVEEEWRMPDGSEFHTAEAATLKPEETKVVRTQGTEDRLVLHSVDNVREYGTIIQKGMEV